MTSSFRFVAILPVVALTLVACQRGTTVEVPAPNIASSSSSISSQTSSSDLGAETQPPTVTFVPGKGSVSGTLLYRGEWFDIEYPDTFTAQPLAPARELNGGIDVVTDEASFLSPNGSVEFFVYSPMWNGDPKTYLAVAPGEKLIDEKTEESGKRPDDEKAPQFTTRYATIQAIDGSFTRSFVSIKEHLNVSSDVHRVFGIKYKTQEDYNKYKAAYLAFKKSLRQYLD
jgi:hypothetical protein